MHSQILADDLTDPRFPSPSCRQKQRLRRRLLTPPPPRPLPPRRPWPPRRPLPPPPPPWPLRLTTQPTTGRPWTQTMYSSPRPRSSPHPSCPLPRLPQRTRCRRRHPLSPRPPSQRRLPGCRSCGRRRVGRERRQQRQRRHAPTPSMQRPRPPRPLRRHVRRQRPGLCRLSMARLLPSQTCPFPDRYVVAFL